MSRDYLFDDEIDNLVDQDGFLVSKDEDVESGFDRDELEQLMEDEPRNSANVGNWGLVGMGYYLHLGDFATYMLSLFLANVLMYFIFYIVMKLVYKERILWPPMIYIILSCLFWVTALYFFYHKSISWKKTPAESRAYNQHCQLLDFYDKHDIWHMLSAGALFFSFMVLLTLDDDLAEKDRRIIAVF